MIKYQYIIGLKGENMTVKKSLTKNKKILKVKFRKRLTGLPDTLNLKLSTSFFCNVKALLRVSGRP
jgi:hypothetical protein